MNQITANLILLFITTLLVSVFYWRIAHKVIVRHIVYRLFARRDDLRRMAIDGIEDRSGFAYREIEGFICKTISVVPSISLASFLWFVARNSDVDSSASERMKEEASPRLHSLLQKTIRDTLIIMFLNSPILFLVSFSASTLLWIIGRFNKARVYRQAESFVRY